MMMTKHTPEPLAARGRTVLIGLLLTVLAATPWRRALTLMSDQARVLPWSVRCWRF